MLAFGRMKNLHAMLAALCFLAACARAAALELHADRSSPQDLAVSGMLSGEPEGSTLYARWADLRALPTTALTVNDAFVKGPQVLTVVFLSDLWTALPAAPGADTLFARCAVDGYASLYTRDFIASYRPFLVLEINGKGPSDWPPPGMHHDPGPYVITVSPELVPAVSSFLDIGHKEPWAVTSIEVGRFDAAFRGIYTGRWSSLSPAAGAGREIWVNSCASCHAGPGGIFSGTKADRPFPVVAAYAGADRPFFMKYVRNPTSLVASAKMEAHPHYTDEQLSELIEFITAGDR